MNPKTIYIAGPYNSRAINLQLLAIQSSFLTSDFTSTLSSLAPSEPYRIQREKNYRVSEFLSILSEIRVVRRSFQHGHVLKSARIFEKSDSAHPFLPLPTQRLRTFTPLRDASHPSYDLTYRISVGPYFVTKLNPTSSDF